LVFKPTTKLVSKLTKSFPNTITASLPHTITAIRAGNTRRKEEEQEQEEEEEEEEEGQSSRGKGKAPRKNWTQLEEIILARSWCDISSDSKHGDDRPSLDFLETCHGAFSRRVKERSRLPQPPSVEFQIE